MPTLLQRRQRAAAIREPSQWPSALLQTRKVYIVDMRIDRHDVDAVLDGDVERRKSAVIENPSHVTGDAGQQFPRRPAFFDPIVNSAHTPIVGGNRINPIAVSPAQQIEIGSP